MCIRDRFWKTVKRTDDLVGEILRRVTATHRDPATIVFSDHGMSSIIDQRPVALRDHKGFPERFVYALDATMVRLWWQDAKDPLKDEVRSVVERTYRGRFLSEVDRKAFHVDFDHRLFGDDIFLLEPGYAIFPNFHSYIRPKAMHAYDPTHEEQLGTIATRNLDVELGEPVEMVHVTSLLEDALGLSEGPS